MGRREPASLLFYHLYVARSRHLFWTRTKSTPPSTSAPPETLKAAAQANEPVDDGALAVIVVTYGYSRDHREDLKQWMLALITSAEGVPQFLKPLDGNASDKVSVSQVILELTRQLRASGEAAGVYVADSGLYSTATMRALNDADVAW